MITTADKLNMVVWAFGLFSVLILLLIALSWYRKKRLSLFKTTWGTDLKSVPLSGDGFVCRCLLDRTELAPDRTGGDPRPGAGRRFQLGGQISNLSPCPAIDPTPKPGK